MYPVTIAPKWTEPLFFRLILNWKILNIDTLFFLSLQLNHMKIEFDPEKSKKNSQDRDLSFDRVTEFD